MLVQPDRSGWDPSNQMSIKSLSPTKRLSSSPALSWRLKFIITLFGKFVRSAKNRQFRCRNVQWLYVRFVHI
uniref:Uncharacterized protein n=1 Tax=Romanomermis culicivorax TaxID=13658 RepID=A0A915KEC0_ROMCU